MIDADHHALAIDVGDAEVRHLGDAEPTGVHGHEQGAMLEVGRGPEQGGHLLRAQDLGQRPAGSLIRDLLDRPVLLELYRERFVGWNVRHFYRFARRDHAVTLSYSFVKLALHEAGLVRKSRARGRHRRRREPRACFGELLHLDGR